MMILKAYHDFLTSDIDLPSCAENYIMPVPLGDKMVENRNDARRLIRSEIGDAVYKQRLPQTSKHTAIALSKVSGTPNYHLRGEAPIRRDVVQVDIFSRGSNAALRGEYISNLVKLATVAFRGNDWSRDVSVDVSTATIQRDQDFSLRVGAGTDEWTFRRSVDFAIVYCVPTAEFPTNTTQVQFDAEIVDGNLVLLDASELAAGRTMTDVDWLVDDGTTQVAWNGPPEQTCTEPNVTGIYRACSLDFVAAGLSGQATISMTITDDNNQQDMQEQTIQL